MALDEPRDGELTVEIDDLGIATDVFRNLGIAPDGEDRVAKGCDRLAVRHRIVDGDDHPVLEHQVGGDLRFAGVAHQQEGRADKQDSDPRSTS